MALVDKEHMTTLYSAADSKATAATAQVEIQKKTVAFAINSAANTGETKVEFTEPLLDEVKTALENKGYVLVNAGKAAGTDVIMIRWA